MTKVLGFDSASTVTLAIAQDFWAKGGRYIEIYEKYATPALITMLHGVGFALGLIYETTAERALGGNPAGYADAQAFLAAAIARFGSVPPANVAPAWAADFDVTAAQQSAVLAYGMGWRTGMASRLRCRCYANGAVCQAAKAAGIVDFTWITGGSKMRGTAAFLATGQEDEQQQVGDASDIGFTISVDDDLVFDPKIPWAWWPPTTPAQPNAPKTSSTLPDLKTAQIELQADGLYLGPIDGIWGMLTREGFTRFYS